MEAGKIRVPRTRIREQAAEEPAAKPEKGAVRREPLPDEWVQLRTKLLRALDRHPEAREDVLRVFLAEEDESPGAG